jgi:ABC-2 type transport system permease protein
VNGLRQVWVLIAHELRRRWRSILIWGVALGATGALYVALYPSMSSLLDDLVKEAPESLKRWMGTLGGQMTLEQWMGPKFLNLLVPMALPFLGMLIGARAVAGNEERRNLDLLLGTPLRRCHLIAGAVGTMAISTAAVLAITWVLTYVAVPIAGVDLAPGHLAEAFVALWSFCLLFGTFSLFLSALVRRAFLATVIPAAVLVAMYLIETLAQVSTTMEPARVVSLFYHLGAPMEGNFPWTAWLLMLAGACVFTGAAAAAFSKRDIYT